MNKTQAEGIYGQCETCGRDIYSFMTVNCELLDELGMCAVCTHGEAELLEA